jgi:hypothetical protein
MLRCRLFFIKPSWGDFVIRMERCNGRAKDLQKNGSCGCSARYGRNRKALKA